MYILCLLLHTSSGVCSFNYFFNRESIHDIYANQFVFEEFRNMYKIYKYIHFAILKWYKIGFIEQILFLLQNPLTNKSQLKIRSFLSHLINYLKIICSVIQDTKIFFFGTVFSKGSFQKKKYPLLFISNIKFFRTQSPKTTFIN